MSYAQWDFIADSINPLLGIALCVLPFLLKIKDRWWFVFWSWIAIAQTEILAKVIRHVHLVPGKFPSTHFAFALCAVTCLGLLHRRAWWFLVPLLVGYALLMDYQNYHTYPEMLGAVFGIAIGLLSHRRVYFREGLEDKDEARTVTL